MDKNIFNNLVDELLKPTYKSKLLHDRDPEDRDPRGRNAITILRPKGSAQPCSDCENTVENRVVHIQKKTDYRTSNKSAFWEKTCINCHKKWPISGPRNK